MTEQDFESQLAEIRQGADFARTMETHYRERAEKLEELATQIWAEKRVQEIAAEARAQVAQKTHTLHITTGQAETRPSAFWRQAFDAGLGLQRSAYLERCPDHEVTEEKK